MFLQIDVSYGVTKEHLLWTVKNAEGDVERVLLFIVRMYISGIGITVGWRQSFMDYIDSNEFLLELVIDNMKRGEITEAERQIVRWIRKIEIGQFLS